MACWCETNDKEKTKSIADAEARISDLTTKIEELTANSARRTGEIIKCSRLITGLGHDCLKLSNEFFTTHD